MGASIRILIDLLRDGLLQHNNLFDYLAYMVKISELTASHAWASVLQFDRAYRQLQAQHGFRWAADTPHLVAVHLQPRGLTEVRPPPAAMTPPCVDYITAIAARLEQACRYRHVCSAPGCQGSHPLALRFA